MGRALCLSVLLVGALASCRMSGASLEHKARSFAPLADHSVGDIKLVDFLTERTLKIVIEPKPTDVEGVYDAGCACAVPITDDGYLLTAAHAVQQSTVFLQFPGSTRARRFRIVWNGFEGDGPNLDLALIHIDLRTSPSFDFLPDSELVAGLRVVSAGFPRAELVFASGELEDDYEVTGAPATLIRHSTPLRDGDSGGPLVDLDGRLVAINFGGVYVPIGGPLVSKAMRPDLEWLDAIVEADRERRRR